MPPSPACILGKAYPAALDALFIVCALRKLCVIGQNRRGVRWDSDHVVILDDPTRAAMEELVRGEFLDRTSTGLDYFDASINRVAAWIIGILATQKALLLALLEPAKQLRAAEESGNHTARLALLREAKAMPWGAVWDEFCRRHDVPVGAAWISEAEAYGQETTRLRN